MTKSAFAILLASLLLPSSTDVLLAADAADQRERVGQQVKPFELKDYRGKTTSLADFAESKIVVLAFLGTECPLAKLYGPRLAELADKFSDRGVAFIGINSNCHDSITEIASHARQHKLKFPVLKDLSNQVADQLGAVRTPEVFVLDQDRIVRYWGRIDDQYGVGSSRDEPQREDLRIAIEELLAGRPVSKPIAESVGCHIGRVQTPNPDSEVTYSNQIARLLQKRCVECHRDGEIAPFALTDYKEVVGWAEMIAEVVHEQRMPPWHAAPDAGLDFKNDRHLTKAEKDLIFKWVDNGAPEGDSGQLPAPATFTTGWQLPSKPDLELPVSPEPFKVKAEGEVRYQYFTSNHVFPEDTWVRAVEIKPGNRAVVHHILAFARQKDTRGLGARDGYLAAYVPGFRVEPYPEGMAKRIPAGSRLVFQVHYTPIGTEQLDQSHIGFLFADPGEVQFEVKTTSAANPRIKIPANAADHLEQAQRPIGQSDARLLAFMPHMHLRGKAFSYSYRQDKQSAPQMLLDIPQYDFNWQTAYHLTEPFPLQKDAVIYCQARYNNSEDNPNLTRDEWSQDVRWGDQTDEEMMIGYFDIAFPRAESAEPAAAKTERPFVQAFQRALATRALMQRLDKDQDGKIQRNEVPQRILAQFEQADANDDDLVSLEELHEFLKQQAAP